MTLDELIERLEEIRDAYTGNLTVALAVQPGYPLRESLRGVAFAEGDAQADLHDEENHEDTGDPFECEKCNKAQETVWLVSGGQSSSYDVSPYAPGWVFENVA